MRKLAFPIFTQQIEFYGDSDISSITPPCPPRNFQKL